MRDDQTLLLQYAQGQDADAFAQIVGRYSVLVFSTARRITRDAASAEDVTQDCFLALARQAASIRGSLPAWLHRVALRRSLDVTRNEATRHRHESRAASEDVELFHEPTWEQIAPAIDQALEDLPDELREPIVQHFLLGLTQAQVATNLKVGQATVSRRLQEGIEALRKRLRKVGLICAAGALTLLLTQNASAAMPPQLAASLAKMAIAGPSAPPAPAVPTAPIRAVARSRFAFLATAAAIATIISAGAWTYVYWFARPVEKTAASQLVPVEGPTGQTPADPQDPNARLIQWSGLVGKTLDDCVAAARKDPSLFDLQALEISLEPISAEAAEIRKAMGGLQPGAYYYRPQLDLLYAAVAAGRLPDAKGGPEGASNNGRVTLAMPGLKARERVNQLRMNALRRWLAGDTLDEAVAAHPESAQALREAYELLGQPTDPANPDQQLLVRLLVDMLRTRRLTEQKLAPLIQSSTLSSQIAMEFSVRVQMTDWLVWHHDENYVQLLLDIRQLKPSGERSTPSGPRSWGEGNPSDVPQVRQVYAALTAFIESQPAPTGAADLGPRDAYKEKLYLARCLHTYLRYQLQLNVHEADPPATQPAGRTTDADAKGNQATKQ